MAGKKQWSMFEQQIKAEIERVPHTVLFKQLILGETNDNQLTIYVRDNFTKNNIENKLLRKVLKLLKKYNEYRDIESLNVIIDNDKFINEDTKIAKVEPKEEKNNQSISSYEESYQQEKRKLNEKYTFDAFVVGSSNELAHAYSYSVAREPGTKNNPLFIYGGSGLGKTHLMQAIGHFILDKDKSKKVSYVSTEKFTNDFIESLKTHRINQFRDKYRKVDVLLIDDIQFLTGKEETQKEFFHTFNVLYEEKKQIVLTSDKPPSKLDKLEERLVSRFKAGLIGDIQKPNLELRTAILQMEAKKLNVDISYELIEFIASKVVSNIRDLEGAFNTVISFKSITGRDLNEDSISSIIKDFVSEKVKKVSIDEIQKAVAEYYNIELEDMMSSKRDKKFVIPRQMAMYISRDLTGKSLPYIGKEFGKKDHTTVIHACKKIEKLINEKNEYKSDFQKIRRTVLES
ncbi:MAG: chromosomal replication initiator protein DnaA [Candidatus Muiribacteriota bacterium]